MLTEIQTIFLTCLLGPEDPKAFSRFQKREYEKERLKRDPEKTKAYEKSRREKNIENVRKAKLKWKANNRATENLGAKERYWKDPEAAREYNRERDKVRRPSIRARRNRKYREDPRYRLECNLRSRIINAVNGVASKSARTVELLGAPWVWVEVHLESLFKPGMTWENYGPVWHIDHIKPCAAFDLRDPDQQRACFHWTNLQPLFAEENLKKSNTYVVQ